MHEFSLGVQRPQNRGQYSRAGGESFFSQMCSESFICGQSRSPLSLQGSSVDPVGSGTVVPVPSERKKNDVDILRRSNN